MTTTIEFTNTQCRCGCKGMIGKKSKFAQGHDARFVSNLKQLALESDKGLHAPITLVDRSTDPATQTQVSVIEALRVLGSPALVSKLENGFRKERDRAEDRAKRETAKALARENAKGRRTSKKASEAAVEVPAEAPETPAIDLDTLAAPTATEATPEPHVEGEEPVAFKKAGRVRRGSKES